MGTIKAILSRLFSPFMVGLYVCFIVIGVAFIYYSSGINTKLSRESSIMRILRLANQKSIDLRLQSRGLRYGSEDVILLTVDEKSLETQGRWPWPREKTAQAIENAIKHGVKVVAFDMVFAEPSDRPADRLLSKIEQKTTLPPEIRQIFEVELEQIDSDKNMQVILDRNSDKIILGSFYEGLYDYNGTAAICDTFIYDLNTDSQIWQNLNFQNTLIVLDENDVYIAETLAQIYKNTLKEIARGIKEASPQPANSTEAVELNRQILIAQKNYCQNWLDPESDPSFALIEENWAQIAELEELEQTSYQEWVAMIQEKAIANPLENAYNWVTNTPAISKGSDHMGYFNAVLDIDGSIRSSRLIARTGNKYMPSIGLKTYLLAKNYNAQVDLAPDPDFKFQQKEVTSLKITDNETGEILYQIPVDNEGRMMINYAGPRNMFPYVSLSDLLNDSDEMEIMQRQKVEGGETELIARKVKKSEFLKNKIAVLGATAIGIFDLRVTPFDENFPGAETHVNVIDNLLRQDFLRTHSQEPMYMFIVLLITGLIISFALAKLGAISGMLLTLFVTTSLFLIDKYFLFGQGIVVAIIFPISLTFILYIGLTFYKYFTEERGKKELRQTFQKYVSPAIVDEILQDPSNIELGGRKEHITVFFSDIRGFTTISEKLDPRALSELLNSYLTPMTELVFKNRGTLDKYMGDAVMAFFGAPIAYPGHAKDACRCALQQLEKLAELQEEYRKRGLPEIDIGIGLNTGECSVGNMGSETVRSYTVMGDSVNLGSRLEGINKQYGTRIIVSEFTYAEAKESFTMREIDLVRVKGKILPVKIYELVSEGIPPQPVQDLLTHFNQGYEFYHQKKFSEALAAFNKALDLNPADGPSRLYIERCNEFIASAPPEEWDGVFIMKTK